MVNINSIHSASTFKLPIQFNEKCKLTAPEVIKDLELNSFVENSNKNMYDFVGCSANL